MAHQIVRETATAVVHQQRTSVTRKGKPLQLQLQPAVQKLAVGGPGDAVDGFVHLLVGDHVLISSYRYENLPGAGVAQG
jgi:hypothetical protein